MNNKSILAILIVGILCVAIQTVTGQEEPPCRCFCSTDPNIPKEEVCRKIGATYGYPIYSIAEKCKFFCGKNTVCCCRQE